MIEAVLLAARLARSRTRCAAQSIMTEKTEREKAQKLLAENRKALHDFQLLETFEAGVVLLGTEVKAIREGRVNLRDSYARVEDGEVWAFNVHISPYSHRGYADHEPLRKRKLLLHRDEIRKLIGKTVEKGMTLVPVRMYLQERQREGGGQPRARQEAARQARDDQAPRDRPRDARGGQEQEREQVTVITPGESGIREFVNVPGAGFLLLPSRARSRSPRSACVRPRRRWCGTPRRSSTPGKSARAGCR